jgi:RNA polymerase sigma-70 factor, ECF subfamily
MDTVEVAWDAPDAPVEDVRLVAALRRGDEQAFALLIDRYHRSLVQLAVFYVRDRAVAEEVVQEVWLAVFAGIDRFERRSSLKTWIFRILTYKARTRGEREGRTVPFSALAAGDDAEAAVEPDRFFEDSHPRWPGHWSAPPTSWDNLPERRLEAKEKLERVRTAINQLPPLQAQVIALRDVEGWSSEEVCETLGLSEGNQRVLLHRARSKVRRALEEYLTAD